MTDHPREIWANPDHWTGFPPCRKGYARYLIADETDALRARIAELEAALEVVLDDLMYRDHQRVVDFARAALASSSGEWEARVKAEARREALEEAAITGYRVCAETRHVTLGDRVAAAIRALAEKGEKA